MDGSGYTRVDAEGLFHLYAKAPLCEMRGSVVLVSTHVDCKKHITACFSSELDAETLRGTYDNAITNAAAVYLMRAGTLPKNVLIAFTGDEEQDGHGAIGLARFLRRNGVDVRMAVVLDVTEEGWQRGCDLTVENDFWTDDLGKTVMDAVTARTGQWLFVPADPAAIPGYVDTAHVLYQEAACDESWDLDEEGLHAFSFCLPTQGDMHSDAGILARKRSLVQYTETLAAILNALR